jgi:hypothetical protein
MKDKKNYHVIPGPDEGGRLLDRGGGKPGIHKEKDVDPGLHRDDRRGRVEEEQPFEKDILKKVYKYEAKKTYKTILTLWIIFIIAQFLIVIIGSSLYDTLKQQQTLDLLQLFNEDFEVIRDNIADVLYAFYIESPLLLTLLFGIVLITFFGIIFFVIKNFRKIKNRLASINKYFSKK